MTNPPKPPGFWKDEVSNLERMIDDGWTRAEMALHYNVSVKAIGSALYKLRLTKRRGLVNTIGKDTSVDKSKNYMQISSKKGFRIKTLEQLLAACHVDTNVWEVDRHIVNTWENYSVKHGHNTLYQVKAWLVRKKPIAIKPVITPVNISVKKNIDYEPIEAELLALVISDLHTGFTKDIQTAKLTPFHDRTVLDIAVKIATHEQPEHIFCMGDWFDLPDFSDRFIRDPMFWWTTQPAIEENAFWLAKLRTGCPNSKIYLFEGNHEKRLRDKIVKTIPEAYGIHKAGSIGDLPALSIQRLLGLDEIAVDWIGDYPNGKVEVEGIQFSHGQKTDKKSGGTVRKILDNAFYSQVVGHSHSAEIAWRRIPGSNDFIFGASCPCACHIDGRVPGSNDESNWSKGLLAIYKHESRPIPELIPIIDGIANLRGEEYYAEKKKVIISELIDSTDERWKY